MDNIAESVQEIESDQHLLGNLSAEMEWDSLIIISLDDLQQVDTQDLKDEAKMISIRSLVDKRIQ